MSSEESSSTGKMVSYSIGGIAAGYLEAAYAILVFFFYEVEVGLPIVYVALGYIIFALWNMINDPFVGYLTDKPRKWSNKWGMRFPWIMISMFPMIIFYFLVYTPPAVDAKTNPIPVFLYMVIMLCIFDFFYSLYSTHYFGTFTMQFRTDAERRSASVYSNTIGAIGGLGLGLIPPLFVVYGDISSYTFAILLVVIVLAACLIIGIPGVKESEELKEIFIQSYDRAEKMSYIQVIKVAFRRKNFIIIMLVYTLFMSGYLLTWSSEIYFYKDVLEIDYSYAVLSMLAVFLCFIISIPIWSFIARKIGHTKTLAVGILFTSITILPYMWINTLLDYIIWAGISGFGFGAFYFMIGIAIADVNDEVALDLEKRQEATLTGIRVFFYRIAFIIQGMVLITVHTMTGYNPDPKAKQTPLAVLGVRIHYALIPAILSFIAFLIFILWYDLKGEKKEQLFSQLREKGLK